VVELGVVIAAIGLALAIVGMLVPTAPPQLASLGWVLLAIGLVLIVVALVLDGVDTHDHARRVIQKVARSSWGLRA
jgi:membrane protein implicated in regulation of membrane protease activity